MRKLLFFALVALTSLMSYAQLIPVTPMHTLNKGEHFKVIFVAEGFDSSNMSTFNSKATTAMNAIKAQEPFASHTSKINFYRSNTLSNSTQLSYVYSDGTYTTRDTYWDVYEYSGARGFWMDDTDRQRLENAYKSQSGGTEKVYVFLICNTTQDMGSGEFWDINELGGSGELTVGMTFASIGSSTHEFEYTILHEFGHTFGQLDDEYVDTWFWQYLVDNNFPLATRPLGANLKDYNPGGWYEGGKYQATGVWRFSQNDIMRGEKVNGLYPLEYCSRSEGLIEDEILDRASVIIGTSFSMTPLGSTLSGACSLTPSSTRYHDGAYSTPVVGDKIFTDVHGLVPFNGGNKYFKLLFNYVIKVGSDGTVTEKTVCPSGGGNQ